MWLHVTVFYVQGQTRTSILIDASISIVTILTHELFQADSHTKLNRRVMSNNFDDSAPTLVMLQVRVYTRPLMNACQPEILNVTIKFKKQNFDHVNSSQYLNNGRKN